jgi:hypothetical protein
MPAQTQVGLPKNQDVTEPKPKEPKKIMKSHNLKPHNDYNCAIGSFIRMKH